MLKRTLITAVAGVSLALAGLIGWLLAVQFHVGGGQAPDPVIGQAPTYKGLTNQRGDPVDSSDFKGKIRVVTFLFPYCTTYCPLIAAHLVGFEHLLQDAGLADRVQIVAFDVDPAGTGAQQMRAFQKEYGWDPDNLHWQFLTGQPAQIRRIVRGGYHVAYDRVSDDDDSGQPEGPAQTPQPTVVNRLAQKAHVDYDIAHNDDLDIVDTKGRVRKIFSQADTVSNKALFDAVKRLLPGNAQQP